jgi:hypothetical protein
MGIRRERAITQRMALFYVNYTSGMCRYMWINWRFAHDIHDAAGFSGCNP